jgi:hypothetical protein
VIDFATPSAKKPPIGPRPARFVVADNSPVRDWRLWVTAFLVVGHFDGVLLESAAPRWFVRIVRFIGLPEHDRDLWWVPTHWKFYRLLWWRHRWCLERWAFTRGWYEVPRHGALLGGGRWRLPWSKR